MIKLNLQNKKIALLGLGVENLALAKFLIKSSGNPPRLARLGTPPGEGNAHITVCDPKGAAELGDRFSGIKELARKYKLPEINLMTGKNYDAHLADFDIVFRSPGYPLFSQNLIKAKKAGVEISSPMKLFFDLCPTKNIIGVTGSKGKGTTSSLIYEIVKSHLKAPHTPSSPSFAKTGAGHPSPAFAQLRRAKQEGNIFLGGNIGLAPFEFIKKIKPNDFVVLELSSFQLEDLDVSPHIAVISNLFKEHLAPADPNNPNYHNSLKAYWAAKANIFTHQGKNDYLVINEKLKKNVIPVKTGIQKISSGALKLDSRFRGNDMRGKVIVYDKSDLPSKLTGEHNKENVAAAVAVAKILKIKDDIVAKAVKKFSGLPHRLELVAEINGVKYFDDSFATVPDVSVIALKAVSAMNNPPRRRGGATPPPPSHSFGGRSKRGIILLAGGADKGSDFKQFVKEINKRVKYLILFKGRGTERIKKEILNSKFKIQNAIVDNMKDAIRLAKKNAQPGDIVMLSTGCASFGCFKNYKDRGDQFKKAVLN